MFRLTAQRRYPDLRIFPQSLSYMRAGPGGRGLDGTTDALDMIDADGDYLWCYYAANFFGDGGIGGVNRVLHPGKPINKITWMGWHRPRTTRGDIMDPGSDFLDGPWRLRGYLGVRSALALWATGAEPGFFAGISARKMSTEGERGGRGFSPFDLKPWSETALEAIDFMLDDPLYWRGVEGQLALEVEKPSPGETAGQDDFLEDIFGAGHDIDSLLDGGPSPLERALQARRDALKERLMNGIGYMNIFNTDTTRALANLPKPDTRLRDTLIITGRDAVTHDDADYFPMPAIAVVQGYDMAPTYTCVEAANLMHYDTILLRASRDGVTSALVEGVNRWLREKRNGLLIVWGDVASRDVLFPMLTLEVVDEPFLWEADVRVTENDRIEETHTDQRRREQTRMVAPRLGAFQRPDGASVADAETRAHCTYAGAIEPLILTGDGEALLARWRAPESISSIVLFDGAQDAGPMYTEALEAVVLELDRERGSSVARNRWWGHTIYENDQFVVDVATSRLATLQAARPRRHYGVDVINGVVNPEVRHRESAMILKDYVGPYAGGRENWAVLARLALHTMTVHSADRLTVEAEGVTRVTRIGDEPIRLERQAGFEQVEDQIQVWRRMRENQPAFSVNAIEGGRELHVFSPTPFTVVLGEPEP